MNFEIIQATPADVLALRNRQRQELARQIVHDSIHRRPGWTQTYQFNHDNVAAGFGSMAVADRIPCRTMSMSVSKSSFQLSRAGLAFWSHLFFAVAALVGFDLALSGAESSVATHILNRQRLRLGPAGAPEWETFAGDPPAAPQVTWKFESRSNAHAATLFIRQEDVRQDWPVELNGRKIGTLFLMEADLVHHLPLPPGSLIDGTNVLTIKPPKEKDDIVLHEVRIDPRTPNRAVMEALVSVTITDDRGRPLPGRLTIVDAQGALAPLRAPTNHAGTLAVRPGVVYTGSGRAQVGLPAGRYTIFGSRGFEWSVATQTVAVAQGDLTPVTMTLRHEVPSSGWVSCDTHVHTFTYSRHGDATFDERMLTLAGEGIELPVATEHNLHVDPREAVKRMGVDSHMTPVPGNEVTTSVGHFNLFPVQPEARVPDFKLTDWPRLMAAMRATPDVQVVVLNHPRNVHTGFQPFAATNFNAVSGDNLRGPEFSFDAMELLNSSAQQSDHLLVVRDWFALLNHGYRVTAVGSSDSHDVSRYIVGQGRTYIACPDGEPGSLNIGLACSNLLAGRALVSMGLMARLTVENQFISGDVATSLPDRLSIQARVFGPSWVQATNLVLFGNGQVWREQAIRLSDGAGEGVKASVQWNIPRPAHDVHLVLLASGPEVTAPFWAIPKPYQPTSTKWNGRVIAVTNPVWVDADGDGVFTPARGYARRLIARHGTSPSDLLAALANFDEATAAQAASLCVGAGVDPGSDAWVTALKRAAEPVRRGFQAFLQARAESMR